MDRRAGFISCMKGMGILSNGQSMILRRELYCVLYRLEMQEIGVSYANENLAIKVRVSLSRRPKSEWNAISISSRSFLKLGKLDFEVLKRFRKGAI